MAGPGFGGTEEGDEGAALGAEEMEFEEPGQFGDDGRVEDGGQGILGLSGTGFGQALLDECGEHRGVAVGELLAELLAERKQDCGDGDGEEDQGREDDGGAGVEAAEGSRGAVGLHGC
jgi:hypothetical protein